MWLDSFWVTINSPRTGWQAVPHLLFILENGMFEDLQSRYPDIPDILLKSLLCQPNNLHYLKRYLSFIQCFVRIRKILILDDQYLENHHIVPVSFDASLAKEVKNIVALTPREHFLAHYIFAMAYGGKHWFSVNIIALCNNPYQHRKGFIMFNSKLYEKSRKEEMKYKSLHMSDIRSKESDDKKISRVEKWKLSSKKCEKCSAILRGDSSRHICLDPKVLIPANKCKICDVKLNKRAKNQEICKQCLNIPKLCKRCHTKTPKAGKRICEDCSLDKKKKCKSCNDTFNNKGYYCETCAHEREKIKKQKNRRKIVKNRKRLFDKYKKMKCDECGSIPNGSRNMYDIFDKSVCIDCKKHLECVETYGENYKEMSKNEKIRFRVNKHLSEMTEEEKLAHNKSVSLGLLQRFQNMSEEEKLVRNKNTSEALKRYYESDKYDPEKKSLEVKRGLEKNKINKKD